MMQQLFCPKCGKEIENSSYNLCRECFTGQKILVQCPEVIRLQICPTCGSLYKKGKWHIQKEEEKAIQEFVKDSLIIKEEALQPRISLRSERLDYSRYRVHIDASAEIAGIPIVSGLGTEVRISWQTCDTCSRISGGYFEGIVQVRASKRLPAVEELKRCIEIAEEVAARSFDKGDRLAFIAKTIWCNEGIDLYAGSTKLGKQICRAIVEVFSGDISESPKLVGQKNGENVYRITFALRLPEFVRGDIIYTEGKIIEVQSCGKHLSGIDLETGRRFIEKFKDLTEIKKMGKKQDAVKAVIVADEKKTVLILDPDTYETVTLKRPEFLMQEPGDEICIIKTQKGIFAVFQ